MTDHLIQGILTL